jgi:MSHA biogenesis protein MshM
MYLSHFQLQKKPFSLTPDSQFFLSQQSHRAALNMLLVALREGDGFIKIVGEVGTGKTVLCRMLLSALDPARFVTAYIPNPSLSPKGLMLCIARELGVAFNRVASSHDLTFAISRRLLELAQQGRQVVILVDEAQAMPRATVESLRLLSNLETEKNKLLQIVLLGQPELDHLLNRRDLRQFRQRIMYAETLLPFNAFGVKSYILHRLVNSGCADENLFSAASLFLIARASRGIPRLINILAHKALICGYGKGAVKITAAHMAKAVADTPECSALGKWLAVLFGGSMSWRAFVPMAISR